MHRIQSSFRPAIATVFAALGLLAVLPASAQQQLAQVADGRAVGACSYVNTVYSAAPARASEREARESVRELAAKQGATHVVWFSAPSLSYGRNQLAGKAYRCAS